MGRCDAREDGWMMQACDVGTEAAAAMYRVSDCEKAPRLVGALYSSDAKHPSPPVVSDDRAKRFLGLP
ncbi:hypothetical protein KC345_g57 [Hortaea werneckii]|nr:hypothetical protein KC345_g57 [Hortaea werneckii]